MYTFNLITSTLKKMVVIMSRLLNRVSVNQILHMHTFQDYLKIMFQDFMLLLKKIRYTKTC